MTMKAHEGKRNHQDSGAVNESKEFTFCLVEPKNAHCFCPVFGDIPSPVTSFVQLENGLGSYPVICGGWGGKFCALSFLAMLIVSGMLPYPRILATTTRMTTYTFLGSIGSGISTVKKPTIFCMRKVGG